MEWTAWIAAAIVVVSPLAILITKRWIKAVIDRSVQHEFDKKIETFRGEIRKNEEQYRSELRTTETEISALRDAVLSGREARQALLDKRRLEAVERVWAAVTELKPLKLASASMAQINFDAAAEDVERNPDSRKVFTVIGRQIPNKMLGQPTINEQPFVSPIAWALFSAYQAILNGAYLQIKFFESGIPNAAKYLDDAKLKNLLKIALPHQNGFIDKYDRTAYHHLLDEFEERILAELRKMLEGVETDETNIAEAAKLLKAAKMVMQDHDRAQSRFS